MVFIQCLDPILKYGYTVVSDGNESVENTDVHRFQRNRNFDDQQNATCLDYPE